MFFKFSQYSQENTCDGVSFSQSCRAEGLKLCLKIYSNTGVFLWILRKFQKQLFLRTPLVTASGSSCSELYEFLDGYFFNLRKCLLRIFPYCHFWNHTYENSNRPVFVNMNLVFLLAICANILVDSLPFKSCQIQICHVHDHQFDRTTYGKADWK